MFAETLRAQRSSGPQTYGFWRAATDCLLAGIALAVLTFVAFRLHASTATAALLFFFFIVFISLRARFVTSILTCILAVLCFDYFFAPPIFDLRARDPQDIVRAIAFFATGLVISRLVSSVRGRTAELEQANEQLRAEMVERRRAEEALRRSESYLAEAQRLTHTGSWVWQVAGRDAVHLSEEWYRIYGFDPEEGMPGWEKRLQRVHPEDRAKWQATINRAICEKSEYEVEFRILLPGGTVKHIHTVGHPVLNAAGDLTEFVGSATDITERKRAEDALRQAQADLAHVSRVTTMGELTASLAHEVNQPIAAAVTNANTCLRWLSRDQPDVEEARAAAMRIAKDGTRAAEIVSRIRLLFKKGTPQREPVDVNEIIREMIALVRSEAIRYNVLLGAQLATDLPEVMADRVQLQQVLMNLIVNGIDVMKDVDGTRELTIESRRAENEEVVVCVRDTGAGLPPHQTEQIFNPFFTTKPHGTGMGLHISRSIVESHGGRLWAADNSPRGATFLFTLPCSRGTRVTAAGAP
jgi:PAS domain S-box-containing protein